MFAEDKKVQASHYWKCTKFGNFKLNSTHLIDSLIDLSKRSLQQNPERRFYFPDTNPENVLTLNTHYLNFHTEQDTHKRENHLQIIKEDFFSRHKHAHRFQL